MKKMLRLQQLALFTFVFLILPFNTSADNQVIELIRDLYDKTPSVRENAFNSLYRAHINEICVEMVPQIIKALVIETNPSTLSIGIKLLENLSERTHNDYIISNQTFTLLMNEEYELDLQMGLAFLFDQLVEQASSTSTLGNRLKAEAKQRLPILFDDIKNKPSSAMNPRLFFLLGLWGQYIEGEKLPGEIFHTFKETLMNESESSDTLYVAAGWIGSYFQLPEEDLDGITSRLLLLAQNENIKFKFRKNIIRSLMLIIDKNHVFDRASKAKAKSLFYKTFFEIAKILGNKDIDPYMERQLIDQTHSFFTKHYRIFDSFFDLRKEKFDTATVPGLMKLFHKSEDVFSSKVHQMIEEDLLRPIYKVPDDLDKEENKEIAALFRKHLDEGLSEDFSELQLLSCNIICKVVKSTPEREIHWEGNPSKMVTQDATRFFAIQNLKVIFFLEISALCEELNGYQEAVLDWVVNDMPSKSHDLFLKPKFWKEINKHLIETDYLGEETITNMHVYGRQFYLLILRKLLSDVVKTDTDKTKLKALIKHTQTTISRELESISRGKVWYSPGSNYTLSSFATVLLALGDVTSTSISTKRNIDNAVDYLTEIVGVARDPLTLNYYATARLSFNQRSPTRRGSAARNIPIYLALDVLHDKNKEQKLNYRITLFNAIRNWHNYMTSLQLSASAGGFHEGADNLAPYFYTTSVPYVTASIQYLLEQENVSYEDKEILKEIRRDVLRSILSFYSDSAEMFTLTGNKVKLAVPETYGPAVYNNLLLGLAFLPCLDQCKGVSIRSSGIMLRH